MSPENQTETPDKKTSWTAKKTAKPGWPAVGSEEAKKLRDYDVAEESRIDKKGREFAVVTETWTDDATGLKIERETNMRTKRFTLTRHAEVTFWYGTFQTISQKFDDELVKLWHCGAGRQFRRGELVIVPSTYLGVARTAILERFRMEPGKPLKVLAPTTCYNFFIDQTRGKNGQATEAEYQEWLDKGTMETRDAMSKRTIAQETSSQAGT